MLVLICVALVSCIIYWVYEHFFPAKSIDPGGKYVLISGCDTGFGHSLAIELDSRGFHVLAGVLNTHSKQTLACRLSSRAIVFVLDITCQQDIDAAFALVKTKTSSLHGLVNNAGIAGGGLIEPDFMRTPIIDEITGKMQAVWIDHVGNETKQRWGEAYFSDWLTEGTKMVTQSADNPMKVISAVCHAITNSKPRIPYRPGWQSSLFCFPLSLIPAWIVDLLICLGQRKMALPSGVLMRMKHRAL